MTVVAVFSQGDYFGSLVVGLRYSWVNLVVEILNVLRNLVERTFQGFDNEIVYCLWIGCTCRLGNWQRLLDCYFGYLNCFDWLDYYSFLSSLLQRFFKFIDNSEVWK